MATRYPGITFVRHPFVRLFSAYQDKFVAHPLYGKYMKQFFDKRGEFFPPSFSSFVDILLAGTSFPSRDIHIYPMVYSCAMCDIK